ncbi:hypothetical protein [Pseudomonas sp. RA_35y_Pfl2_P32]|uniref:hypothetical protein n=1 Tax=Pseudomonas sp. RA_35y_Pfl2_P32 TaxID=3088705 RepID=UPI0030DBAF58
MIEPITEGLVIQAAQEWAARKNKSPLEAASNAKDTITALRAKLTGEEFEQALDSLYREYNES